MRFLYVLALIAAVVSFILAILERVFGWRFFGYEPGAFLKFTDTSLLFAILFMLVWWMKRKES